MKTFHTKRQPSGFVSYLLVLTTATLLSLLSILAYRRAMTSHRIESQVQLRIDYSEKEEAILRSIVAIVPNKAMVAMRPGSAGAAAPLSWASIFSESLAMGNSRTSIPPNLEERMGLALAGIRKSNTTDSTTALLAQNVFREIKPINPALPSLVSVGAGSPAGAQVLGAGYPPLLNFQAGVVAGRDATNDRLYPIVTNTKQYGPLAAGRVRLVPNTTPGSAGTPGTDYQRYNLIPYPQINFGYGTPGEDFIAKRNWWAFSLNAGGQDTAATNLARVSRDFVLSIYEIPSQLSISSAAYTEIGTNKGLAGGGDWQAGRVNLDGGVFTSRSRVSTPANAGLATPITALASRNGMDVASGARIGGEAGTGVVSAAGVREEFLNARGGVGLANNTTMGAFYPMSLASDSGRLAFIPISGGETFYDRFMQPNFAFDKYNPDPAANSLSSTAWNDYTIGARQCAMQLDITQVASNATNINTQVTLFSYLAGGVRTNVPIETTAGIAPPGYIRIRASGGSYNFGANPTDVAYGTRGTNFVFLTLAGNVVFNDATFPNLLADNGFPKSGYIRSPFEPKLGAPEPTGIQFIKVYPKRFPLVLAALGADPTDTNNSLVVNVNYAAGIGLTFPVAPTGTLASRISTRYTLVLDECLDLTSFPKGFSLVTNMNLNFAQPFNDIPFPAANLPLGYVPARNASNPAGYCYPPCSIFAPSKQYGNTTVALPAVVFSGQLNSVRTDDNLNVAPQLVNPLKAIDLSTGAQIPAANLAVNFRKIRHPVELPPINMMNWMVLLEEVRREYQTPP